MADVDTETPRDATGVVKTEPASECEKLPSSANTGGNVDDKVQVKKEHTSESTVKNPEVETDTVQVKKENGSESNVENSKVKTENGDDNSSESASKTAEDNNDPALESKVVRQIEYYFGDINLPRDRFLQEQVKVDNGWVPIEVLLRFRRLRSLTVKPETIVKCLQSSSTLMEISEDQTKLRRLPSKPLPENTPDYVEEMHARTVYCKGFPQSSDNIDVLLAFFAPYGPVENITMRRRPADRKSHSAKIFKGSVYVLFNTKELADKFLALESVSYEGKELIRMTRSAHVEEMKREREEKWGKKVKHSKTGDAQGKPKKQFPKGCILKMSPLNDESISRDKLKEALVALGADVAFIEYDKGDPEAFVRLFSLEDGAATKFIKGLEDSGKKVTIINDVELAPLEGEEEETFLNNTRLAMEKSNQRGQRKRGGFRGGRGNFRGKHRGNKRSGSPMGDGATPAKQAAVSD